MIQKFFRNFSATQVKQTTLYSWHKERMNAKMVNFADYMMPVSYPIGGL